jgi:hypothetical protein
VLCAQPCARLIEYPRGEGEEPRFFFEFVPLPESDRGGTTWHELAYWVRPGPIKGPPTKKTVREKAGGTAEEPRVPSRRSGRGKTVFEEGAETITEVVEQ